MCPVVGQGHLGNFIMNVTTTDNLAASAAAELKTTPNERIRQKIEQFLAPYGWRYLGTQDIDLKGGTTVAVHVYVPIDNPKDDAIFVSYGTRTQGQVHSLLQVRQKNKKALEQLWNLLLVEEGKQTMH